MRPTRAAGVVLLLVLLAVGGAGQSTGGRSDAGAFRFLVSLEHPSDDCLGAVDAAKNHGSKFLSQCDWGCVGGDHTCYITLRASDEAAVREMLPLEWDRAKIIKLVRFTPEQVESFHQK